jgi:hypothetical protein
MEQPAKGGISQGAGAALAGEALPRQPIGARRPVGFVFGRNAQWLAEGIALANHILAGMLHVEREHYMECLVLDTPLSKMLSFFRGMGSHWGFWTSH